MVSLHRVLPCKLIAIAQVSSLAKSGRLLAILDDAIADGCITPIEVPVMQSRRQVAYSLG